MSSSAVFPMQLIQNNQRLFVFFSCINKSVIGNQMTKFWYWLPDKKCGCLLCFPEQLLRTHNFDGKLKLVIHQRWSLIDFSSLVLKRAERQIHGCDKGLWFPFLVSLAISDPCLPLQRVVGCHLWQKIGMKYGVKYSSLPKVSLAAGIYIYTTIVTVAFW